MILLSTVRDDYCVYDVRGTVAIPFDAYNMYTTITLHIIIYYILILLFIFYSSMIIIICKKKYKVYLETYILI